MGPDFCACASSRAATASVGIRMAILAHLYGSPHKYPLTLTLGEEDQVFELIRGMFQQSGEVLTVKRAADMVERWHSDRATAIASYAAGWDRGLRGEATKSRPKKKKKPSKATKGRSR